MKTTSLIVLVALLAILAVARIGQPTAQGNTATLATRVATLERQVVTLRQRLRRNTLRDYCADVLTFGSIKTIERHLIQEFLAGTIAYGHPDPLPGRLGVRACTDDPKAHPIFPTRLWPTPPPGGPLPLRSSASVNR
jgi:hypothetical protein